jgi:uncharacterized membrane protein YgdD (TMEM256/DUF423 family)
MTARSALIAGSITGMLAVTIGAFGAHGLKSMLVSTGRFETFNLAVEYQFYHALALLVTGILWINIPTTQFKYAAMSFISGIILFSGSLYLLAILNKPVLGAITPFGGVCFILGWLFLVLGILKNKRAPQ